MKQVNQEALEYKANLQRVGAAIPETITLLIEYARRQDWGQVRAAALKENLLQKGSSYTVKGILTATRQRFWNTDGQLPPADVVSQAMITDISPAARSQILYLYICATDSLVRQTVLHLVKPLMASSPNASLSPDDVRDFLRREMGSHPELQAWSDYLQTRWSQGFLALLRDFGLMEPAPSNRLLHPVVRVEAFAFFLLWLLQSGTVPLPALEHPWWDLYLMRDSDKQSLLAQAQARGWLYYSRAADIVELQSRYASVEEWIHAGLG
jgi:hypothetical protein